MILVISQLQAIFLALLSYSPFPPPPPPPIERVFSSYGSERNGGDHREMFYLLKIQRSVEVRTLNFCKDTEKFGTICWLLRGKFYFRLHVEHHAVNDYRLVMLPALFCCS